MHDHCQWEKVFLSYLTLHRIYTSPGPERGQSSLIFPLVGRGVAGSRDGRNIGDRAGAQRLSYRGGRASSGSGSSLVLMGPASASRIVSGLSEYGRTVRGCTDTRKKFVVFCEPVHRLNVSDEHISWM